MLENQVKQWDAQYDVVVLGFGGAGATAARFAADRGAKVLLVDSAPEGHEGGNTRYCGQLIMAGSKPAEIKEYYLALNGPMNFEPEITDVYTENLAQMREYVKKYLGVEPVSVRKLIEKDPQQAMILGPMTPEYPELPGADDFDFLLLTEQFGDGALWKNLRQQVVERAAQIDVWFNAPAEHLILANDGRQVTGAQIKRAGQVLNIKAQNGVVLTLGGFENNPDKMQNYVGEPAIGPIGSLYNQGKGIDLAIEAGADLWHMPVISGLATLLRAKEGQRPNLMMGPALSNGSIFRVGDDGSRYQNENAPQRHGYLANHGLWRTPLTQAKPWLIFDQAKHEELAGNQMYQPVLATEIKAATIEELAKLIDVPAKNLVGAVEKFNAGCQKEDDEFNRAPETMREFVQGPYYAVPLGNYLLNTQGGPRRNARAEVLDVEQQPIQGLYAAGELGSIWGGQYQGGGDIADCLIFGKIAGENAATEKNYPTSEMTDKLAVKDTKFASDLQQAKKQYTVGQNQYIGYSNAGMGDEMIVRVTVASEDKSLRRVEILQQSETDGIGDLALKRLSQEMVAQNTADISAVSGASDSSQAIKEAVKDALAQI